eukprot:2767544-Pyramimonas_sp.AAC.1
MSPPLDMGLKAQLEGDERDVLKYRRNAAKRGAFPRGITWTRLEPTVNLEYPELKLQEQQALAVEKQYDEEDLDMHSPLQKYRVDRSMSLDT